MNGTQNLFSMDWIESFDLLNLPINSFSYIVSIISNNIKKSKKELMIKFPETFSEGLARYTNTKVTFKIKDNVTPIFRPKRKVSFAAEASISKELNCLKQIGLLINMVYSEWASTTVYVKNKNKIRAYTDFSTGLNDCLETYYYPLPRQFVKLSGGEEISKLDLSKV